MAKQNYREILPIRYVDSSFDTDVPEAIKNVFAEQMRKRNGLYMWGPTGVGKTHTMAALLKDILEKGTIRVMFFKTPELLDRLRDFNQETDLMDEIMSFDGIVFLDDIGAEKATDWVREKLFLIINKKYDDCRPMFFTSNCDLETLQERLGDRITSRISGMTKTVQLTGKDKRNQQDATQ